MGNYTGPKVRLSRAVGVPIAETGKHLNLRRTNRPGMHGYRRARQSLYGKQLIEKQKIAFYYNVSNKQLRRYVQRAQHSRRQTIDVIQELLETRIDNVIRRLGWARTIWQARQAVAHGHFRVNGRRVNRPSYHVRAGDVITVRERSKPFVKFCAETAEGPLAPGWLAVEENKLEGNVVRMPVPEDIRNPFEVSFSLIIEFYSK